MRRIVIAGISAGLWLAAALPVQAGLFSSRFDDFKELVLADQTAAAALMLDQDPAYFNGLEGGKKAFVTAFRNKLELNRFLAFAQAGQDAEALALAEQKKTTFLQLSPDQLVQFNAGVKSIRDRADLRLIKAREALKAALPEDLSPATAWQAAGTALAEARAALIKQKAVPQLADPPSEAQQALIAGIGEAEVRLATSAGSALAAADPFAAPSILKAYPVPVDPTLVAGYFNAVKPRLLPATAAQLESFNKLYGEALSADQKRELGGLYLDARLQAAGPVSAMTRIKEAQAASKLGFSVPGWSDYVLLVTAANPEGSQVPISLAAPTVVPSRPLAPGQTPSDVVQSDAVRGKQLVVFVSVSPVNAQVIQNDKRSLPSRFRSGSRQVSNPAYYQAQQELQQAETNMQQVRANQNNLAGNNNWGVALLSATTSSLSESNLQEARNRFATTPPYLDEAVFNPYNYVQSRLRVERKYKVAYAAFDLQTQEMRQGQLDRGEGQDFVMVEDLHPGDPAFAQISAGSSSLADVQGYQLRPMSMQYDAIWKDIQAELMK